MKTLQALFDLLWNNIDGILGVLVQGLYAHVFQKRPLMKNLASVIIGLICCSYLTEPVHSILPGLKPEVIAFLTGLLGMNIIQSLLELDLKSIVKSKFTKE